MRFSLTLGDLACQLSLSVGPSATHASAHLRSNTQPALLPRAPIPRSLVRPRGSPLRAPGAPQATSAQPPSRHGPLRAPR